MADVASPDVRFLLANERTFLAWQRTSVGLVAAALAVLHLFDPTPLLGILGFVLLGSAAMASGGGWWHYRRTDRAIRAGEEMPGNVLVHAFSALILVTVAVVIASVVW